jgi:hypothetical protein
MENDINTSMEGNTMNLFRALSILAGMLLLLLALAACSDTTYSSAAAPTTRTASPTPTAPPPTATPLPSNAYQLATIDGQGDVPSTETVAKYQTLLDNLHDKTGDSEQTISDETVQGQQLLAGKGKTVTLFALLTGADASVTKAEHMKYADVMAALVTLMENS